MISQVASLWFPLATSCSLHTAGFGVFLSEMSLVLLVLAHCNDAFLDNSCTWSRPIWIDGTTGTAGIKEFQSSGDLGDGHQMLLTDDNTKITTGVV